MVTAEDELLVVGVGEGDGDGAAGDDELELPHAMVNTRRDETTTIRLANIRTSTVWTFRAAQRFAVSTISETRKHTNFSKSIAIGRVGAA